MNLFETVFNRVSIYGMLFVSIDSVLEYPTLDALKTSNTSLYRQWLQLQASLKADAKLPYEESLPYEVTAIKYPEYCKIVAISYGNIAMVNGEIKRSFRKIANLNEELVIEEFIDVLNEYPEDMNFPSFCGFGLIKHGFPLFIKRFLINRGKFSKEILLPAPIKNLMSSKPWDGDLVIDVDDVWKFNGNNNSVSLSYISDYLNFKKTVEMMNDTEPE